MTQSVSPRMIATPSEKGGRGKNKKKIGRRGWGREGEKNREVSNIVIRFGSGSHVIRIWLTIVVPVVPSGIV